MKDKPAQVCLCVKLSNEADSNASIFPRENTTGKIFYSICVVTSMTDVCSRIIKARKYSYKSGFLFALFFPYESRKIRTMEMNGFRKQALFPVDEGNIHLTKSHLLVIVFQINLFLFVCQLEIGLITPNMMFAPSPEIRGFQACLKNISRMLLTLELLLVRGSMLFSETKGLWGRLYARSRWVPSNLINPVPRKKDFISEGLNRANWLSLSVDYFYNYFEPPAGKF